MANVQDDNVIRAFSADHVVRLTGLTKRQLNEWDETGFFKPQYAHENRRSPYARIYSFRDVVGLRVVSVLRNQYRVSMQQLRKVAKELSQNDFAFWGQMILYVVNREVSFHEPETQKIRGVVSRQYVVPVPLEPVIGEVRQAAEKLKERTTEKIGKIERNRLVMHNAPVIAGTRIPTGAIKRFKEAGYSIDGILKEYPSLTKADVEAALKFEGGRAA
ncbi:MAG TPA: DUF433 domain-containing protein [Xanthobacteraceae bacterium]|nr:DUF433 domain-containing protein [Xanthobacteraceae bacterium]